MLDFSKTKNLNKPSSAQYQSGAGLVEVMVSLLILAVGLLGVLSLQANGLNSNQRALFVTEAQMLAQDMADRIIAFGSTASNIAAAGANAIDGGLYNNIAIAKADTLGSNNCANAACGAAATRAYDINEWLSLLQDSSLPLGQAAVTWASPVYTIQVFWDEDRDSSNAACNANNCFQMQVRFQ